MSIQTLVALSNTFGSDENFVLAGGGNTSFKDEQYLYIKGSGTGLAHITADGFVKMNRKKLDDILCKDYPSEAKAREAAVLADLMASREMGEEHKRPSVETLLHNILPFSYVVHLHPALVNGLTCSAQGEKAVRAIFGDSFIWIENTEPGYVLSKKVYDAYNAYKAKNGSDAQMVFLQNHGVFTAANTAGEVHQLYSDIMGRLEVALAERPDFSDTAFDRELAVALAPALRMLTMEQTGVTTFFTNKTLASFLQSRESFAPVSGAFTPDHIVYCGAQPLFIEDVGNAEKDIAEYKSRFGRAPRIITVADLGVYACGATKKDADTAKQLFLDAVKIAVYTKSFGGHSFMPQTLVDFITSWEAESYRKSVGTASGSMRAQGKTAIVTGSAQGFGQGIAEALIANGANVIIADLNGELAGKNAAALCEKYGAERALAVQADVTNSDSVKNMVDSTVLAFGGIDVLVNNAGIVRAGGVDELDDAQFDLVVNVNYTAYFYCVKHVAKIMKIQHQYKPDYFMDIIQINSKSGLTGSLKNFAYAGSKFGGIGLTQSFALEFAEFNIKVNAICPGNFYDGPLWSDPERGLFVQYLNAGKVPGAKTVADVRRFYEQKAPLKRGCTTPDVAKAIFYCLEQEYETGQAIPVTGGQVMLS